MYERKLATTTTTTTTTTNAVGDALVIIMKDHAKMCHWILTKKQISTKKKREKKREGFRPIDKSIEYQAVIFACDSINA